MAGCRSTKAAGRRATKFLILASLKQQQDKDRPRQRMNTHNSKPAFVNPKDPVAGKDDEGETHRVSASLNASDLVLADEPDDVCDPYNSTGKHFILSAKLARQNRD